MANLDVIIQEIGAIEYNLDAVNMKLKIKVNNCAEFLNVSFISDIYESCAEVVGSMDLEVILYDVSTKIKLTYNKVFGQVEAVFP